MDNKVALVTGGTSGIGLAVARRMLAEGARVVITGSSTRSVDAALAELGGAAVGFAADLTDMEQVAALPTRVAEHTDHLDVLFANAGISRLLPFEAVTERDFDDTVALNLKGTFFTVQRLVPLFTAGGSIVLNGSATAARGVPGNSVYAATKGGIGALAANLSAELIERGIRVNTIAPGAIDTPLWKKIGFDEATYDAAMAGIAEQVPVKRLGSPEDVAALVTFLGSDDSSYIVGDVIPIGGGYGTL